MKPSVERFTGFADVYDQVRPSPPDAIADLLRQFAKLEMAGRVVDLGCGSGLSMAMWVGKTRSIIGVEPSDDMRREAERRCSTLFPPGAVEWISTEADATQIAGQSVDIVTASQSFHWMNPETTLPEVARILQPGGIFAAIDCDWPPSILPEVDLAYDKCVARPLIRNMHAFHWPESGRGRKANTSRIFDTAAVFEWQKNPPFTKSNLAPSGGSSA